MKEGGIWLFIIIGVIGWFLWSQHSDIVKLRDALSEANANIDTANNTIEELNSQIDDAKSNAWSDYETMGYALDNLEGGGETASTISDPTQK